MVGQRHAELVLDAVDALLGEARLDRRALGGVAFGAGPGSFTGLRIACGVAQGLAFALGVPVLGVSSLETLAESTEAARVAACLDARMGEVYFAAYVRDGPCWQVVVPPGVHAPGGVPALPGEGWVGAGSGFGAYAEALHARLGRSLARTDADAFPCASALLRIALPRLAAGEGGNPASAAPLYVRDKVALKTSERR